MIECANQVLVGSTPNAVTQTSDIAPDSSKDFLGIQTNYSVSIQSETCTCHANNIQLNALSAIILV